MKAVFGDRRPSDRPVRPDPPITRHQDAAISHQISGTGVIDNGDTGEARLSHHRHAAEQYAGHFDA
jgi:hypothetical protein